MNFNYDFEKTGMLVDFNTTLKLKRASHCQNKDAYGFALKCHQNCEKILQVYFFPPMIGPFSVN